MLNQRAWEILSFIQRFSSERGYPPTIREIGTAFSISSTNGVRYYLNMLERAGHVKRNGKISRGIECSVRSTGAPSGIPILGRVAAGQPVLAQEHFEGNFDLKDAFGDRQGLFALKVRGDSMVGAGIHEGDYVIVRQQERAQPGEIIVAMLGEEATVKYFQPRQDHIELVAANPKYDPIVVDEGSEFRILGTVRGVVRIVGR